MERISRRLMGLIGLAVVCWITTARAASPPTYVFAPSGEDCCGGQSAIAPDPFTPGRVISGGDVYGFHRSLDYGRDWAPVSVPVSGSSLFSNRGHFSVAAVRFSLKTPDRVYAGLGNKWGGDAFVRSDDGGSTWAIKSTTPDFMGGNAPAPLNDQHPRSVGNLIALDATQAQEIVYVGTFSKGVMRSTGADPGANWATISLPGLTKPYIRGIAMDDTDPTVLYAAVYDTDNDGTNESVYKITGARSATQATLIPAPFLKAEEMVVCNGVLYVAASTNGVYKYEGGAWTQLYTDTKPSLFYSIDGYWDAASSQAILYAGTANGARNVTGSSYLRYSVIRSKNSGAAWTCLTDDESKLHKNMKMGDDTGDIWWHSSDISAMLGGGSFVACQTVIDPTDRKRLYVCGRAGGWRTDDALTVNDPVWYPIVRHENATVERCIAADPNVDGRVYHGDVDWTFLYSTDSGNHWTQKSTSLSNGQEYLLAPDGTTNPGAAAALYFARGAGILYTPNVATTNWSSIGPTTTQQIIGVSAKKIAEGTVVLAAVENDGIWRKVGAGSAGTWSKVYGGDNVLQALDGETEKGIFSWGGGASETVYFTDKSNGVFRSLDGGKQWSKIASPAMKGSGGNTRYCGSVAVDPTDDNNCYVTQTSGVWFSSNAKAATPTFSPVSLPAIAGAMPSNAVYDDAGNIYINTLVEGSTGPKIYYKGKGETSWTNIVPASDPVFRSLAPYPMQMSVGPGPAHKIYVAGFGTGMCIGSQQSATAPAPVTDLRATAGDKEITLQWTKNPDPNVAGYWIYRSNVSGSGYAKVNNLATGATWTNKNLTNGLTYYYVMKTVDTANNSSEYSNEVSATPRPETSVTDWSRWGDR